MFIIQKVNYVFMGYWPKRISENLVRKSFQVAWNRLQLVYQKDCAEKNSCRTAHHRTLSWGIHLKMHGGGSMPPDQQVFCSPLLVPYDGISRPKPLGSMHYRADRYPIYNSDPNLKCFFHWSNTCISTVPIGNGIGEHKRQTVSCINMIKPVSEIKPPQKKSCCQQGQKYDILFPNLFLGETLNRWLALLPLL